MKSTQTEISGSIFEKNVKTSDTKATANDKTPDTANKRYDHHLIDQDLELEDKNGRRLNPKAEQQQEDRE